MPLIITYRLSGGCLRCEEEGLHEAFRLKGSGGLRKLACYNNEYSINVASLGIHTAI
jgi:hypothetical protein